MGTEGESTKEVSHGKTLVAKSTEKTRVGTLVTMGKDRPGALWRYGLLMANARLSFSSTISSNVQDAAGGDDRASVAFLGAVRWNKALGESSR